MKHFKVTVDRGTEDITRFAHLVLKLGNKDEPDWTNTITSYAVQKDEWYVVEVIEESAWERKWQQIKDDAQKRLESEFFQQSILPFKGAKLDPLPHNPPLHLIDVDGYKRMKEKWEEKKKEAEAIGDRQGLVELVLSLLCVPARLLENERKEDAGKDDNS